MNSLELEFWVLLCLCYIFQVMLRLTNAILAFWDWCWVKQNHSKSALKPLWFLLPSLTLVLLQQASHQQQPPHRVQRCSLSAQPNVPEYGCPSCSQAARAAPSSHGHLPHHTRSCRGALLHPEPARLTARDGGPWKAADGALAVPVANDRSHLWHVLTLKNAKRLW